MILAATLLQLCLHASTVNPDSQAATTETTTAHRINTWLVLGTFDSDAGNSGFDRDWIGETGVRPTLGAAGGSRTWQYFDDRLFSRNYDDYQDLFSYFSVKRSEPVAAKVVYAHVHVYSEGEQEAQLDVGADNEFKAWFNGAPVVSHTQAGGERDQVRSPVRLNAGWNRLLLKIANQENGRLGFYARLCDRQGKRLAGAILSPCGPADELTCTVPQTPGEKPGRLPVAYRRWPYVQADALNVENPHYGPLRKASLAMQASAYTLTAGGGTPPYRWALSKGELPAGLELRPDGTLSGTVAAAARLGEYPIEVQVTDRAGAKALQPLRIPVQERPGRWYEHARLTALIHSPESMPPHDFANFARLMKRQGYGVGMVISYNNGDHSYRWPSIYDPNNPLGDLDGKYKAALEAEGIRFGMYIGNFDGDNHGGRNGAILVLDDLMRRYKPAAIWFDWAGWDGFSLDAMFSVIRAHSPDTVIVLNGIPTMSNGDWDVLVLEGWGAWGPQMWDLWPAPLNWPKYPVVESWRLVADPVFDYTKDIRPDWREYLRVQISLICEGFVANIDHSPTIRQKIKSLKESVVIQCHEHMAEWANPPGAAEPLHKSYTQVDPGPLDEQPWGYNTINADRNIIYLHMMTNPYGKTGMPADATLAVGPMPVGVRRVTWMNRSIAVDFRMENGRLAVDLANVKPDEFDTIIRIDLAEPWPDTGAVRRHILAPSPPGNLATGKPAAYLSINGDHALPASGFHFAHYGVDGTDITFAQAGSEWAWTYQVDLQAEHLVDRTVIHFGPTYATEYELLLSADGRDWTTVAHVTDGQGGSREHRFARTNCRFVRIRSLKPDAPGQPGVQMSIAELEIYGATPP